MINKTTLAAMTLSVVALLPAHALVQSKPNPAGQAGAVQQSTDQSRLQVRVQPRRITAGSDVSVYVKTEPRVHVSIEAQDVDFMQFPRLLGQNTDELGNAQWRFHIGRDFRSDLLPIIVSADIGNSTHKAILAIPVTHPNSANAQLPPLSFISFPPQARAGDRVTVTVKTQPGAKVRIEAQGAGFPQASSLLDRTAGKDGLVTWTWQIRDNYESDYMPVMVTSSFNGGDRKVVGTIHVLPGEIQPLKQQKK